MRLNSKCKICRRAGEKLFLKGERCFSQKCALTRRSYPPGIHGPKRRRSLSEYGLQLREKQKLRYIYGITETQLRNYFEEITGKEDKSRSLLSMLEHRLDNVVYRLGFAKSRRTSRQIISHGHILVNGRKVDIPSYQVRKGDIIKIKKTSIKKGLFKDLSVHLKNYQTPSWLSLDKDKLIGKVIGEPTIQDIGEPAEIEKVIEFYSR